MTRKNGAPTEGQPLLLYFPLYTSDWLTSLTVRTFSLEQRGAYLELLIAQWMAKDCRLPGDEVQLAQLSGLGSKWKTIGRPILRSCFRREGTGYVNLRCRAEWNAARERIRKSSEQGREGARQRWGNHA